MPHQRLRFDERGDAGLEEFRISLELVRRVFDQVGFAKRRVAVVLQRLEREDEPGVEPRRGVVRKTQVDRDAISGFEADAVDLAGDAIGLVREDGLRGRAEMLRDLHALAGRDTIGLQKNVELALGALLVPRLFDRGGAFFADALDVAQLAGLLAEDAKRLGANASTILLA